MVNLLLGENHEVYHRRQNALQRKLNCFEVLKNVQYFVDIMTSKLFVTTKYLCKWDFCVTL